MHLFRRSSNRSRESFILLTCQEIRITVSNLHKGSLAKKILRIQNDCFWVDTIFLNSALTRHNLVQSLKLSIVKQTRHSDTFSPSFTIASPWEKLKNFAVFRIIAQSSFVGRFTLILKEEVLIWDDLCLRSASEGQLVQKSSSLPGLPFWSMWVEPILSNAFFHRVSITRNSSSLSALLATVYYRIAVSELVGMLTCTTLSSPWTLVDTSMLVPAARCNFSIEWIWRTA